MLRKMAAGTINVIQPFRVKDTSSAVGGNLAGLAFNTAGLIARYRRRGDANWTTVNLVTAVAGTYVSGGFCQAGNTPTGAYEVHWPDAMFDVGVPWVEAEIYGAANMLAVAFFYELDAVNYQDGAGFGLSRFDAAITSRVGNEIYVTTYTALFDMLATMPSNVRENVWSYNDSDNPLSQNSIYRKLLRAIGVIGSAYKALGAAKTGELLSVTIGDDMTEATGVRYRFSFTGFPSIQGKPVKGQIVKRGSGLEVDNLAAAIEDFSVDLTDIQTTLVSVPEEVSGLLTPSDGATNYELACRVEYTAGKWVEVGRSPLEVLRG